MKKTRERIIPSFVFSFSLMIVSSFLLLFMNEEKSNMGVLSATIPGIGMLQESFGLIEKDIQSIKESVERIEVASQQTAANSEIIKDSLKDVQRGFAALTQSGGIIRNPEMPEQFYHNALRFESLDSFQLTQLGTRDLMFLVSIFIYEGGIKLYLIFILHAIKRRIKN